MKTTFRQLPATLIASLLLAICGCSSPKPIEIRLTGTPGTAISGYYISHGKRVELKGALPMTLSQPGISQLAVRKANAADILALAAVTVDGSTSTALPPGQAGGLWLKLEGGMSVGFIPPEASLAVPDNSLMVISPYWHDGTWVFDDPTTGLVREPFVAGVPDVINHLVKDIPDAKNGFRLTFSAKPFPGYQEKLVWLRAEAGGNYYHLANPPMDGWLCPAMFKYFKQAPKNLYVKADPKTK